MRCRLPGSQDDYGDRRVNVSSADSCIRWLKPVQVCVEVWVVDGVLGQLGRAVKAIDSKSIGATRVS